MAIGASLSFGGQRPVFRKPPGWGGQSEPYGRSAGSSFTQTGAVARPPGASFNQTGAATAPPRPPAPPAAPPTAPPAYQPPDLSGNKWMAYLSPDQLNALNQTTLKNTQGLTDWYNRVGGVDANGNFQANPNGTAEQQYQTTMNAADLQAQQQTAQANEEMAARGLFQSSIRDNDLTDIQRTRVERQGLALSTLNSLIADATSAITALNGSTASALSGGQGLAATNAAALATPPPAGPPAASGQPPRVPTPSAPTGPIPSGPPRPQQPSSRGPGASFTQTSASTGPARPGARPPTVGRNQIGYHGGF